MAQLTYHIETGILVATPEDHDHGPRIIAMAKSGGSNRWWDSARKAQGDQDQKGASSVPRRAA
jgi:hypothetical protein